MKKQIDKYYMSKALLQAKLAVRIDEVPIGALVVDTKELYKDINRIEDSKISFDTLEQHLNLDEYIISEAYNLKEKLNTASGHAELLAIDEACRLKENWRLAGCTVYVTLEPCLMCAGLMYQARIDRCVFGAADPKAGALGSLYVINTDTRLNHKFKVTPNVLENECSQILKDFFKAKRKNKLKQVLA